MSRQAACWDTKSNRIFALTIGSSIRASPLSPLARALVTYSPDEKLAASLCDRRGESQRERERERGGRDDMAQCVGGRQR